MAAPQPVAENYAQPSLSLPPGGGWKINSVDLQIVTKSANWNQDQSKRLAEYQEIKNLGANYVALGVPYDSTTKFTDYVTDARTKGFKILFRSHWNAWEGDNSASANLSSQSYLDNTYDFIVANPDLFQDGDLFATCVECNNANNKPNTTYPFRTGNVVGGAFNFTLYNRFLRDQITYANAAFAAVGKSVGTWPISMSLALLNLAGQTLDSGTTGNDDGFGDADIVNYFGGVLSIDHYLLDSYRYSDATTYWDRLSSDLDKLHLAFPSCKIFVEEWGYHTSTDTGNGEQHGMFEKVVDVFRSKDYIMGVNFWTHMASNTASIFIDSGGTILPGARNTSKAIQRAFSTGNVAYGSRGRV